MFGCKASDPAGKIQSESGNVLQLFSYAPDSLNPITTKNNVNREMLNLIYEPLIWCDNSLNPIPILATDWSCANEGMTWYITIRENVLMHDGNPLTTADVIYSLNSARSSDIYSKNLTDVQAVSASGNVIIIDLKSPQPSFINLLEIPIVRNSSNPIGTGCYTYAGQITNKIISLTAFPDWWNSDKPHIKNIEVKLLPDANTSFFAYDAGEIDVVFADVTDLGKYTSGRNSTIATVSTNNYNFLMLNNTRLNNIDFRKAISYAINKEKIASDIFGSRVTPTNTFLNPNWTIYSGELDGYDYNPKASRDILEAYKGSRSLEIIVNSENESRVNTATFISENLKEVGIDARIRKLSWDSFAAAVNSQQYDAFLGEISLINNANCTYLFGKTNQNYANYSSTDMETAISSWYSQSTYAGMQGGYHYMQEQYLKDLPFISLYFELRAVLYSDKIICTKGFTPIPNNTYYGINYWQKV
jgi:ABC-type transport system substrate-binding protein